MAATPRLNFFAGAPSGVVIESVRGPNGYFNTSCMLIRLCFQQLWFSLILPGFGMFVFWPLAVERTSRHHLFPVSSQRKWWTQQMICNVIGCFHSRCNVWEWLIWVTRFKWVHPTLDGVHDFVDFILHEWHTGILVLLAFSVVETCHFSASWQGLGSVVNVQDPALYYTSVKTAACLCLGSPCSWFVRSSGSRALFELR